MPTITPFLWFDDQAEEAVDFYVSVFPNSGEVERVHSPDGNVLTVRFQLDGKEFVALNGGPDHYGFDESISFLIDCPTQADVDYYWGRLLDGGAPIACGWLRDRFGLRWQVVPSELMTLLSDPDSERAARALDAMMKMTKLDVEALKTAAAGVTD